METNQSTYLTAVNIKVSKPSNQITELSNHSPPPIVNTIDITPEKDTIFSIPQKIETKNQYVEFLKYTSQRSNLLKTEFVNFLLKDENFSDLNEPEKFLREKAIENIKIINKNDLEIKKKKDEYEKILLELNTQINHNIEIKWEEGEEFYKKRKEELERKIKDKKQELSVFQNTYKKEYKERYLMIQKQKEEVQNIKINSKQYEKYNLLNKKISFEANQKDNLLNDVKKYVEQSRKIFSEEIDNKTKAYKDLELELHILRQSTEDIEKSLNSVIDKRNKVIKLIDDQNDINNFIQRSLEFTYNDYFLNKMILLRNTEMNNMNLDDIINGYNEVKKKAYKLKTELFNTNQEITNLNEILHKLNNEYEEKKEEKKKIIKQAKHKHKYEEKDSKSINKERELLKDKIQLLKIHNKEKLCMSSDKTNLLIFCYKYLFQSANILYKSYENSKIDFHFDSESMDQKYDEIIKSKYYELINIAQKYINKQFKTNGQIFEEGKNFFIFGFKIFLFYASAINLLTSNILNLSCFSSEDLIDKFPLSQFNTGIFSFKENDNKNIRESANDVVINKGSNKVIIKKFFSKEEENIYQKNLNLNSFIINKKYEIMNRSIEDLIRMNNINSNKTDIDNRIKNNYPNRLYFNFLQTKDISNTIKNSRYIKNHPSSSLLSLKRFFNQEDQKNLFNLKSVDINNKNTHENGYTKGKLSQRSFDGKMAYLKSPKYKKMNFMKNKNINDEYLSKEYRYEIDIDDYQEKNHKNKRNQNSGKHIFNFAGQDPQKQLIFTRMMDIRNLELQSGNSNTKSTNVNEITDDKINENKFYEMYDKFKKKYFFNPKKIKEGIKGNISYKKINQNKKLNEITKIKRNSVSNHINIKNGMKFIRNNSDFFYGVKGSNSLKNKYRKFELPSIKNKLDKNKNGNSKNTNDLTSN